MRIRKTLLFFAAAAKDGIVLFFFIIYTYLRLVWRWIFPHKPKSLQNEVILITGTANGIGRQICLKLVNSGAKLVCWDINKRENNALIVELKSKGGDAYGYDLDVSDMAQVHKIAAQVKEQVGDVTMIINNAGIMPVHPFLSHNPREISRVFQVNTLGPLWLLREFLPQMIDTGRGHVTTICSGAGFCGARNLAAYCGSKHGIDGVIESLRDELRFHPKKPVIKFTTVYPAACNTSFAQNVVKSRFPWIIPRLTEPDYVAEKVIQGILNETEYVYIPKSVKYLPSILRLLPSKVYWSIYDYLGVYVEPKENTRVIGGNKGKLQD